MESNSIKLNMFKLPVLNSLDDLSLYTHISKNTLYRLSARSFKYYKVYTIPKKSGKLRTISQPSKKLKGIQSWILINILNDINVSENCKGFSKNSSIIDNVKPHIGNNSILNIDLEDFYPSITREMVYFVFIKIGFNNLMSNILTNICIHKNSLPQGGPCSPKLANLCTWKLDLRIQGYVGSKGITYTRYSDDMTFSGLGPQKIMHILPMVKRIIKEEGFDINYNKVRISNYGSSRKITGLILYNETFGIGDKKYKLLRAKIFNFTKKSLNTSEKEINEIKGWFSYLNMVDQNRLHKLKKYVNKLALKFPNSAITLINSIYK